MRDENMLRLRETMAFSPLRDMAEDAGIHYETAFGGRVESLNDDTQTTVYRICEAAVRDASRSQFEEGGDSLF